MQSNDSRSRRDLTARLSNLSRFSEIIAAAAARQSDDPRARTPMDLNCKLISLLCSQPPSAYHLSPIRDAVARHASHRLVARARTLPGISSNLKRAGVLTGAPGNPGDISFSRSMREERVIDHRQVFALNRIGGINIRV